MTPAASVLAFCVDHLELEEVRALASTSKLMLLECLVNPSDCVLQRWMLHAVAKVEKAKGVEACSSEAQFLQTSGGKNIAWLLQQCSRLCGITTLASRLGLQAALVTAGGHTDMCKLLIDAGGRFTHDLFYFTARHQLGPLAWVKTYQSLGLSLSLPRTIQTFCSRSGWQQRLDVWELQQLSAQELLSIASLGCSIPFSCDFEFIISSTTAPQAWTPAEVQQLLRLSLVCSPHWLGATTQALLLASLPGVQQLPWDVKLEVLELSQIHHRHISRDLAVRLLPRSLSIEETTTFFQAAIHWPHPKSAVNLVMNGDAACGSKELPGWTVKELIAETMRVNHSTDAGWLVDCFLSLPAAAQLSAQDALDLLLITAASTSIVGPCFSTLFQHLLPIVAPAAAAEAADVTSRLSQIDVAALLRLAVTVCRIDMQWWLLGLPAAKQLSAEAVAQLLLLAISSRQEDAAVWLLELPGAQLLTAAALSTLMVAAISHEMLYILSQLTCIPAAQQLAGEMLTQPLGASIAWEAATLKHVILWYLWELPGVQLLTAGEVQQLLKGVLTARGAAAATAAAGQLLQLPAVKDLTADQVRELLQLAARAKTTTVLQALLELPVAEQVLASAVAELLSAAIACCNRPAMEVLVQLPAAFQLSADEIGALLKRAVAAKAPIEVLLQLPESSRVKSDQLLLILESALALGQVGSVEVLLQLPAAAHLTPEAVGQLLQQNLQEGVRCRAQAVPWLMALPGAKMLSLGQVVPLVSLAVQHCLAGPQDLLAVQHRLPDLVAGPAAELPSGEQLEQLLRGAVAAGSLEAVGLLLGLPRGQEVTSEQAGYELLAWASQHGLVSKRHQLVEALVQKLPACQRLSAKKVYKLLLKQCHPSSRGGLVVACLMRLQGAKAMEPRLVCLLLGLCIEFGNFGGLARLMKLPGAQLIPCSMVEQQLLVPAIMAGCEGVVLQWLLELPGAQELSWEAAFRLVELCCKHNPQGLPAMWEWMGQKISDVGELGRLAKEALARGTALSPAVALELLGSAAELLEGLSSEELKGLLQVAVEAGDNRVLEELLELPGAESLRDQGIRTTDQLQECCSSGMLG